MHTTTTSLNSHIVSIREQNFFEWHVELGWPLVAQRLYVPADRTERTAVPPPALALPRSFQSPRALPG